MWTISAEWVGGSYVNGQKLSAAEKTPDKMDEYIDGEMKYLFDKQRGGRNPPNAIKRNYLFSYPFSAWSAQSVSTPNNKLFINTKVY